MAPKIEIIGAGLAGLALAEELVSRGFTVRVFEKSHIGAGASGVAAGLVHPYLGQSGKRSLFAEEALSHLKSKLHELTTTSPADPFFQEVKIQKFFSSAQEKRAFLSKWSSYGDCEDFDEMSLLVHGLFIDTSRYLSFLASSLEQRGVSFVYEEKQFNPSSEHYLETPTVFCIGALLAGFPICFSSKLRKGQVLVAKKDPRIEYSFTTTGYVALSPFSDQMVLGSSYEREFEDGLPDQETAAKWIYPRLSSHLPPWEELKIVECRSGIRIAPAVGYLPVFEKKNENLWVFGGFGSRGLLYHTLFAKKGVDSLLAEINIPSECAQ